MARIDVYAAQSRDFYRSRSIRIAGVILLCLTAIAAYFVFAAPVHQLYWGIRARMNPMLDENDFKRLGKQWVTVEGDQEVVKEVHSTSSLILGSHNATGSTTPVEKEAEIESPLSSAQQHVLTHELIGSVLDTASKVVVVTLANYHYLDFVLNWLHHLKETGCRSFLIGTTDDKLLEELVDRNITNNVFAMNSSVTLGDFGWGSPTFHKGVREKVKIVQILTHMGYDVLFSDVDAVWRRNPLPYVQSLPEADILTSSDMLRNTVNDESLEQWPEAENGFNSGIFLVRKTATAFAREWLDVVEADDKYWEQAAFNDLIRRKYAFIEPRRPDNLHLGYDNKLLVGVLPVSVFCSGHTYFVQRMHEKLGLDIFVAHATFQFSGTPGKRHRFREMGLWIDDYDYFDYPGGFVYYKNKVDDTLLEAVRSRERSFKIESTVPHFNLVNSQLLQFRSAMFVSNLLDRGIVLPEVWCGYDRWWAPHEGIIPGSKLSVPFVCPADHVFDLESMDRDGFVFREYSFLEKPQGRELSRLVINICEEGDASCRVGGEPMEGVMRLQPGLTREQLKEALSHASVKEAQVIELAGNVAGIWKPTAETLANSADDAGVKSIVDRYMSIWCCVDAHPGHVWYDAFWDIARHMDRHNRMQGAEYKPFTGP